MMKNKTDDSWEFEIFRLIEKSNKYPENLTRKETKRLKEFGIIRDENAD